MSAAGGSVAEEAQAWYLANWDTSLTLGEWWRLLAASGWGQPAWPVGRFGRGLSRAAAAEVVAARRQVGAFGGPTGIATMLTGPTLLAHGTPEQLDRYLPGVVTGEHVWCQLFSEPGAGSDLASLRTRAERDGDQWVVNGQKVWTSGADIARYGLLIARTDVTVPKHRGITYFVIDMHQPGVDVRPLRDMTGRAHFNEVFLDDAVVAGVDVVGDVGDGWRVALTTLASERSSLGTNTRGGGGKLEVHGHDLSMPIRELLARAASEVDDPSAKLRGYRLLAELAHQRGLTGDPVVRQTLARSYGDHDTARISSQRVQAATDAGRHSAGQPPAVASTLKLVTSKNLHALGRATLDVQGPYGTLAGADALLDGRAFDVIATAFTISIGGGTDQIQRNIIGERVLGLPAEPRIGNDVAFRDLPASGTAARP
jgi:alkylation response protein AidB-like acyl-CoA dehydrogenase